MEDGGQGPGQGQKGQGHGAAWTSTTPYLSGGVDLPQPLIVKVEPQQGLDEIPQRNQDKRVSFRSNMPPPPGPPPTSATATSPQPQNFVREVREGSNVNATGKAVSFRTNLPIDKPPPALEPAEHGAADNCSASVDQLKVMKDKHAVVRARMERTMKELEDKKKLLLLAERETYIAEGHQRIAEQKVRGITEKLFNAKNSLHDKEQRHHELVKELVEVKWKRHWAQEKCKKVESNYLNFQVDKAIRIDKVVDSDVMGAEREKNTKKELDQLKAVVDKYQNYKDRLAAGDPELAQILSGDKLVELEIRKNGIKDAFARREARVEGIYMEIDEKNEAVKKLRQSVLIKEKQNQAKLRKLQRELQDKEATESHLKQTVEYLDRQIDSAVESVENVELGGNNSNRGQQGQQNYSYSRGQGQGQGFVRASGLNAQSTYFKGNNGGRK